MKKTGRDNVNRGKEKDKDERNKGKVKDRSKKKKEMKILTLDNTCFSLNNLPEELEEDVRFSVLDNSDPNEPDFFFMPLIFLEM